MAAAARLQDRCSDDAREAARHLEAIGVGRRSLRERLPFLSFSACGIRLGGHGAALLFLHVFPPLAVFFVMWRT